MLLLRLPQLLLPKVPLQGSIYTFVTVKKNDLLISDYNYPLPEERIAKFPLEKREMSKLLIYNKGNISESQFYHIGEFLPQGSMLVFNNTKVIRARLIFHKPTGARIEIFCLEPYEPADYERAFAIKGSCKWSCIVGNLKKWKEDDLHINFEVDGQPRRLTARKAEQGEREQIIEFSWDGDQSFGQLLETLGRIPIPPYLCRESEEVDNSRYQTVYSKFEGSVAAPTAGLHFTPEIIDSLRREGHLTDEVTLHVGAGTFLPVKTNEVVLHKMHTEHFEIKLSTIRNLIAHLDNVIAVGTTSVRTLESLCALGWRIQQTGTPDAERPIGQWEIYDIPDEQETRPLLNTLADYLEHQGMDRLKTATQIMIMPGYRYRIIRGIITNFHQPQSTLLLLVSALIGEDWRKVYDYALSHDFRFLSYGDSSLLLSK